MQCKSGRKLLLVLATLPLAGCAFLGEKPTPLPETTKLVDSIPRVRNSGLSPCWQQREIAKQNAWFDSNRESAKAKKEVVVVYDAPCDAAKPPQKVAKAG